MYLHICTHTERKEAQYIHIHEIMMQILPGNTTISRPPRLPLTLVFSMQSILTAAQSSHHSDWLSLISMVLDGAAGPVQANEKKVHM